MLKVNVEYKFETLVTKNSRKVKNVVKKERKKNKWINTIKWMNKS